MNSILNLLGVSGPLCKGFGNYVAPLLPGREFGTDRVETQQAKWRAKTRWQHFLPRFRWQYFPFFPRYKVLLLWALFVITGAISPRVLIRAQELGTYPIIFDRWATLEDPMWQTETSTKRTDRLQPARQEWGLQEPL